MRFVRAPWPLAAVAVVLALTGCGLFGPDARFDEPTLTDAQARQAATSLATTLDDLAARFLVADPATEDLHVVRWEDDADDAAARLSEQFGFLAGGAAFARATADELHRSAARPAPEGADDDVSPVAQIATVETRVAEVEPIGRDDRRADWLRVDIVQDETYTNGETASTSTSYGVAVREGAIVEVRDLSGLLAGPEPASAGPIARQFVEAVLRGDEETVQRHTADEVTDRQLAALRAWLSAAGGFEVAELPAAQLGSRQVAYVVPEHGPLVRFTVDLDGGTALVTWEVLGAG